MSKQSLNYYPFINRIDIRNYIQYYLGILIFEDIYLDLLFYFETVTSTGKVIKNYPKIRISLKNYKF